MQVVCLLSNEIYPNIADLDRKRTCQGAPDVAAHSLGQVDAYFTVREVLAEASKGADGVLWREHSGFGRCRFAMLGYMWILLSRLHIVCPRVCHEVVCTGILEYVYAKVGHVESASGFPLLREWETREFEKSKTFSMQCY